MGLILKAIAALKGFLGGWQLYLGIFFLGAGAFLYFQNHQLQAHLLEAQEALTKVKDAADANARVIVALEVDRQRLEALYKDLEDKNAQIVRSMTKLNNEIANAAKISNPPVGPPIVVVLDSMRQETRAPGDKDDLPKAGGAPRSAIVPGAAGGPRQDRRGHP